MAYIIAHMRWSLTVTRPHTLNLYTCKRSGTATSTFRRTRQHPPSMSSPPASSARPPPQAAACGPPPGPLNRRMAATVAMTLTTPATTTRIVSLTTTSRRTPQTRRLPSSRPLSRLSPRAPSPPSFLSTASPSSRSGVPLAATPSALRSLAPKATLARRLPSSRPLSRPSLRAPPPSFLSAAPPSSQSGVPLAPSALRPLASEATLARCRPSSRSLSQLSLRAPPSFQPARTKGLIPSTTAIATATWCRCAFRFYVCGLYFADLSSCVHVSGRYTPYRIRHSRSLSKISAATGSVITR